jgi:hypothetical protein
MSHREANATPPKFADTLIELAEHSREASVVNGLSSAYSRYPRTNRCEGVAR